MWSLWAIFCLLLAVPLGAVGRRIDGGVLETWTDRKWGKITTRFLCAGMLALPMFLAGLPPLATLAFIAATWLGGIFGMGGGMGMGRPVHDRTGEPESARAWSGAALEMTGYGVLTVVPAVTVLGLLGYSPWPLALTGLACAACYELAFRAPLHWPAMGCLRQDPPPTAEMIWGALRGVAGVATVLLGAG